MDDPAVVAALEACAEACSERWGEASEAEQTEGRRMMRRALAAAYEAEADALERQYGLEAGEGMWAADWLCQRAAALRASERRGEEGGR